MGKVYTVGTADAAKVYGLAERTMRKRFESGEIPGFQIGRTWWVRVTEQQLLDAGIDPSEVNTLEVADEEGGTPTVSLPPAQRAVPQAASGPSVDLEPMARLISELTERHDRIVAESAERERQAIATAAMWQERSQHWQEKYESLERQLTATATPDPDAPAEREPEAETPVRVDPPWRAFLRRLLGVD